jgi:hypothetical protein
MPFYHRPPRHVQQWKILRVGASLQQLFSWRLASRKPDLGEVAPGDRNRFDMFRVFERANVMLVDRLPFSTERSEI